MVENNESAVRRSLQTTRKRLTDVSTLTVSIYNQKALNDCKIKSYVNLRVSENIISRRYFLPGRIFYSLFALFSCSSCLSLWLCV